MGIEPTTTGTTILRFVAQDQRVSVLFFLPVVAENARLSAYSSRVFRRLLGGSEGADIPSVGRGVAGQGGDEGRGRGAPAWVV